MIVYRNIFNKAGYVRLEGKKKDIVSMREKMREDKGRKGREGGRKRGKGNIIVPSSPHCFPMLEIKLRPGSMLNKVVHHGAVPPTHD